MSEATTSGARCDAGARERRLDFAMLRQAARHLDAASIKDGTWFKKLVAQHAKHHQTLVRPGMWDALYPGLDADDRATKHIKRVARKASAAGAIASLGASTGELLSLFTEGLAAPVGVPAAALSMALEAAYTALLQVDLACDLASLHGVPFNPDDTGELATLFAVALEIETAKKPKDESAPKAEGEHTGLTERLIELEEGDVAGRIGRKLLEESVMKNVIPVVGVAISARWNYVATKLFGGKVNRYVRYRKAIKSAFSRLHCESVSDHLLVIEGAWLLASSDGEPTHEEVMAIALLAEALSPGVHLDTDRARVDDEEEWLERLAKMPPASYGAILDALYLIAGTDRELQNAERRMLRRVGKAMGRPIDFDRIEQICRHLADGEDLPADFVWAAALPLPGAGAGVAGAAPGSGVAAIAGHA